jgi:hypothetical protein
MLTFVYVHECVLDGEECLYHGHIVEVHPEIRGGAAFAVHPVCVQTLQELKLMEVRRD